eukprot:scaffold14627_cov144-Isochrysis_galbana.AAC.1
MLSLARRGPDAVRDAIEQHDFDKQVSAAHEAEKVTKESECVDWWMFIMALWDEIPSEHCLQHPRMLWNMLYEDVYLPYIQLWGTLEPYMPDTRSDFTQPPGQWFRARRL